MSGELIFDNKRDMAPPEEKLIPGTHNGQFQGKMIPPAAFPAAGRRLRGKKTGEYKKEKRRKQKTALEQTTMLIHLFIMYKKDIYGNRRITTDRNSKLGKTTDHTDPHGQKNEISKQRSVWCRL
ncbi:hypothetical protein FACS189462_2030 [Spirochaetia bacterium]|nr:hypothetical protein FACS189462_2030 [Spirochaetia bacterium]